MRRHYASVPNSTAQCRPIGNSAINGHSSEAKTEKRRSQRSGLKAEQSGTPSRIRTLLHEGKRPGTKLGILQRPIYLLTRSRGNPSQQSGATRRRFAFVVPVSPIPSTIDSQRRADRGNPHEVQVPESTTANPAANEGGGPLSRSVGPKEPEKLKCNNELPA